MQKLYIHLGVLLALALAGCTNHDFNLAYDQNSFTQSNKSASVPIDILWVIDNSGSMANSQNQIATNVAAFIDKFQTTNFDFRIAVTTTGAYQALPAFSGNQAWSRFRDGTDATSHSGVFVITPTTPNLEDVFQTNILQGINGSADERGFQSLEATLANAQNMAEPFPRPGAYLAVIMLTDEEDFSWDGTANIQLNGSGQPNPSNDPRLHSYTRYTDILDAVTESTATQKNYVVNTIAIFDQTCLDQLQAGFPGRRIANRYAELTDATGGVKASLCGDFSEILSDITDSILIQSTKFYLTRLPQVDTLQIFVNNVEVPTSGWDYNAADNSVSFHADTIPPKDAQIRVMFLPAAF